MYNHNKAQQSKNRVHISWDILYLHKEEWEDDLTSIRGAQDDINGLVQDCSNSTVLAMELLQSCTKPSIYESSSELAVLH